METLTTYAEWSNLLDKFGQGDDTAIEELTNCSFAVDAGTAARFYSRVEETYKKRKQTWLDKFQRSFQQRNPRTADDFEIILRNGKQNLSPLIKLSTLKGLPDDLRKTLRTDLECFVGEIKKSLKDNVSKTSNFREKMLVAISTFGLNETIQETQMDKKNSDASKSETLPPTGRKIIF